MSNASSPLTMDAYRKAAFRKSVIAQLHQGKSDGKTPEQLANEIAAEQRALAVAIITPEFVDAASAALLAAQQQIAPNARYQTSPVQAKEAIRQIMRRRAAEADAFAQSVTQPDYYQPLAKQAEANVDTPIIPSMHEVKMKDVLDELLHLDATGAPQVIAHIDATAKGTMIEHDELALVFVPDGALHKPLMNALAKQLPAASESRIHALTSDWLQEREASAKLTSALAANNGAAYLEAVRRSQAWHRQKHDTPATAKAVALLKHLTPEEAEKAKTQEQHAEDIAYTINHSLYCTLTDFLNPPINTATDGWLRWLIPGCGHDHSKDGGHHHDHGAPCAHEQHAPPTGTKLERVKQSFKQSFSKERFIQYAKGEFIGDFGAVPLTIGVQRLFPNFMNGVRKLTEPLMRPLFNYGIERSSKRWAEQNNVNTDSEAYKEHKNAIYEHEMSHFPQAVVWTGFSLGLNTAYQMHADKCTHTPFMNKLALKSTSVLSGVLVTAGMVVAARAFAPHKVREFDQWTSKNAILPATKAVGKLFGVKEEDVDRMAEKQKQLEGEDWGARIKNAKLETERSV